MNSFKEFVLTKVIWKDTEYFDKLIEAATQIKIATSVYLNNTIDKRIVSSLYYKIFDLTNKPKNVGVNIYLYDLYTKVYNIEKEKYCTECQLLKPLKEFYSNGYTPNGNKKYKAKCKQCNSSTNKQKLNYIIENIYGKLECKICKYSKCKKALEFHHINPSEKEFRISDMATCSIEKIKKEIEKCILVCANCHREIHDGFYPHYLISE